MIIKKECVNHTSCNGVYEDAPPQRCGAFFRLEENTNVGIPRVDVMKDDERGKENCH